MAKMKGPGIFLAQFMRDQAPFNSLKTIAKWAADLGYAGVQIPAWDSRCIDLDKAARSQAYCDDLRGDLAAAGVEPTELATHLQGQCVAMHPAYEIGFAGFAPAGLSASQRAKWAAGELKKAVLASEKLGLSAIPTFSGSFAWHMIYPWPQRPAGLIDEAFGELAKRWLPLLDFARDHGCTFAYELHPGSDLFDGATFEMFLQHTRNHKAAAINYDPSHFVLQQLDYCQFIELYGRRITAFHVKDAEFRPSGRVGVYGGYQPWAQRAGRFRSLGDGQVDFKRIFTLLAEAGYASWAVLEWECCVKDSAQGAAEGAPFIRDHIIETTAVAFDDFAGGKSDTKTNRKILGLS
jgi:sugar phosphate isomerase/epimerase